MIETLEEGIARISALKHDWDGKDSQAYSKKVCEMALEIGKQFPGFIEKKHGLRIGPLTALPSSNGIELRWKGDDYELLLFVPEKGEPHYYGADLNGGNEVRGSCSSL